MSATEVRAAHPWRAPLLVALFLSNLAVVLLLWWIGSGSGAGPEAADRLNAVGRVTGLTGTYLVLVQLVLRTHVPWLVGAFGKDALRSAHRWNAYLLLALLVAHGAAQWLGYALEDGVDPLAELGRLVAHYEGVVAAIAGLIVLVAITLVAIVPASHRLPWSAWRAIHLYAYVGVALSVPHQVVTGKDFGGSPLAVAYWVLLYAAFAAVVAVTRAPAFWRAVRTALPDDLRAWPRASVATVAATAIAMYLLTSVQVTPLPLDIPEAAEPAPLEDEIARPPTEPAAEPTASPAASAAAGTEYVGALVETPYGDAQVRIVVSAGRLIDVVWEVRPGIQRMSWQISDAVLPYLSRRAVRAQSADIDVITGATYTSNAFKASLGAALRDAGMARVP